jgi:8-oxo-dGTP diphosphatase
MKTGSSSDLKFAVLAADVACFRIMEGELCVLLGKTAMTSPFPDAWALIGGLVHPEETADQAAARQLREKAGIEKIFLEQLYTFSTVNRDPRGRVVSVAYYALTYDDPRNVAKAGVETRWVSLKQLPKLAYDHDEILKHAVARLRLVVRSTNAVKYLLPHEFTLSGLQDAYEIVIGEKMDKRNFRKKILASGMVKDMKRVKKEGVMRPASLYAFTARKGWALENL